MATTSGADFPESVKLEAKKRAAFKCCLCHTRAGDEVHHITPKAEGGTNDIDNAVLLCAQCHNDNGTRQERRKFIREARDWWYERVRERYSGESIGALVKLDQLATKADIDGLHHAVGVLLENLSASVRQGSTSPTELVNAASTMVSSFSVTVPMSFDNTIGSATMCTRCFRLLEDGEPCPNCKPFGPTLFPSEPTSGE